MPIDMIKELVSWRIEQGAETIEAIEGVLQDAPVDNAEDVYESLLNEFNAEGEVYVLFD